MSRAGDVFPGVPAARAHVVVDAFLADALRPHQREGVRFMYEAVCGLRRDAHTGAPHFGCLLAHEMGMGNVKGKVMQHIKHGEVIATGITSDACVVAGIATWGGYALAALFSGTFLGSGSDEIALPSWEEEEELCMRLMDAEVPRRVLFQMRYLLAVYVISRLVAKG